MMLRKFISGTFYVVCMLLEAHNVFSQCWPLSQKLVPDKHFNTTENFGSSISYENDVAVVGAPSSDTLRTESGVVYVFQFTNGNWQKVASLTPSDHRISQYFGQKVLIHNDYIYVGDPGRNNVGAVYIYKKPVDGWQDMVETFILTPDIPQQTNFGISMDAYENKILIGAPYSMNENNVDTGAAFIYEWQSDTLIKIATLKSPNAYGSSFGSNVVLGKNTAVVVAEMEITAQYISSGATYVFEKDDASQWTDAFPDARLVSTLPNNFVDGLGKGLALDESRSTIFVTQFSWDGTRNHKTIDVYQKHTASWTNMTETAKYINDATSDVTYQTLRFEEPYLYAGGGPSVELFVPDVNNEWSLSAPIGTLVNRDFNLQQRFGTDLCVDDGHVLVAAPASLTSNYNALILPSSPAIYEFVKPGVGWTSDENFEDRSFTYMPITATDYLYGTVLDIDGDFAVVGSPKDNVNKTGAGAVYVYHLSNYKWNKIATLTPSDGEPNDFFGWSVAISENTIAVGVPNKKLRDNTGQIIYFRPGAVYVFKKPAAGWSDVHEAYKITLIDGEIDFGINVDLDYPYLVTSRFDRGSRPNVGSAFVYNISGSDGATLEATLTPSFRDWVNNFGASICIRDSVIAIGCGVTGFWMGENNAVFLYQRSGAHWKDATESAQLIPSDTYSRGYFGGIGFGESISMTKDGSEIIVGAPAWLDSTVFTTQGYFKGAAYIFTRPQSGWKGPISETVKFTIPNQQAYACMGTSVYIEERYAVVGSPQNYFYTRGSQNPGSGRVYFYQKPDSGWHYKLPDKTLIGDESGSALSDYFGVSVSGVHGYLFIGASADDNQNSVDAGAVYVYTEYPFINLQPPVCENANPVQLTAVSEGGMWQGSGFTNSADGIFHPSLAGPGTFKIRYRVDDCDASNTLLIQVIAVPDPASLLTSDSLFFCGKSSVTLSVPYREGITYDWSFSESGSSYTPLAADVSAIDATGHGYYKITATNICASASDQAWVGDLSPNGGNNFSVCISAGPYQMHGNYSSGIWSGTGVNADGVFSSATAGIGFHPLYYSVSPSPGCVYRDTVTVQVVSMPDITIKDNDNTFCYTGTTKLSASSMAGFQYTWYFGSDNNPSTTIGGNVPDIMADEVGFYKVKVSNGLCEKEALYQVVLPPFKPEITPLFDSLSFCHDSPLNISAAAIADAHYVWSKYIDNVLQVQEETTGSFSKQLQESGKFRLRIESHGCVFESDDMTASVIPADSVFVPNVFTPNGDEWNERFEIYTRGADEFNLKVIGRYGEEIWAGQKNTPPWDAAGAPSGIYFWLLTYHSQCRGDNELKGWVHVVK